MISQLIWHWIGLTIHSSFSWVVSNGGDERQTADFYMTDLSFTVLIMHCTCTQWLLYVIVQLYLTMKRNRDDNTLFFLMSRFNRRWRKTNRWFLYDRYIRSFYMTIYCWYLLYDVLCIELTSFTFIGICCVHNEANSMTAITKSHCLSEL